MTYQFDRKLAIENFVKRKKENTGKQTDNGSLYAGSPMYYYCKHCGVHTETLPELHFSIPKTVCDSCKPLVDHGLMDDANKEYKKNIK